MMKKVWIQIIIILLLSVTVGLAVNQFSGKPLPVFQAYKVDTNTDKATGEDLTVYFNEMDAETLESLRQSDMVVILDARTPDRYQKGHIPGAISLPISTFAETYDSVKPKIIEGKSLVLYCIGVHCIDSSLLARELSKKGHQEIFVFKGGMEEWQALGFDVQTPDGIVAGTPDPEGGSHEGHDH